MFDTSRRFVVLSFCQNGERGREREMPLGKTSSAAGKGNKVSYWVVAAIVLAVTVITGGVFIMAKHGRGPALEITAAPGPASAGRIYIGGAVNNPGIYPLQAGDTIDAVLKAAGGLTAAAAPDRLELSVPAAGEADAPQKVDINRAEAWLLAALPGIGEARAQAIIDYRRKHGAFRDINELLKVPGMGDATLAGIKDLITVGE
jgi:competence protein ComEA